MTILVTVLLFALLQSLLAGQLLYEHKSIELHFSRDLAAFMTAMIVLARLGWRLGNASIFGVFTVSIIVFDYARAIGAVAMGQDPLLYDAVLLISHMLVLFRDMMGETYDELFWKVLGGMSLSLLVVFGGLAWIAARHRKGSWVTAGVSIGLLWAAVWGTTFEESPYTSRFSTPAFVDNLQGSVRIWSQLREGIGGEAYEPLEDLKLSKKPDIHIYLVESYGNIMNRRSIRDAWQERLQEMNIIFEQAGWYIVTGSSQAPVSGGRSWLADASLLSGIRVEFESVYRHLMPAISEMPNVVSFLRNQGYRSLLVRPKDRARPGVELVNHFDFEETAFYEDIEYSGRSYGWSGIPDQYVLGRMEEQFIPALGSGPRFVFFHMATSHIPWNELPPVVEDWRTLDAGGKPGGKKERHTKAKREIKNQLKRFKRSKVNRVNRLRPKTQNLKRYAQAIEYDLEVLTQYVQRLPTDRPSIVILMGDHQPPMIGNSKDFRVPMHVLSNDPALLAEFKDRGFSPSMRFNNRMRDFRHEGFFSVLARALARADDQEPIEYFPHGAVRMESIQAPDKDNKDERKKGKVKKSKARLRRK